MAINEGVELTKKEDFKFAGLVNGVLRQVMLRGWDLPWPDKEKQPVRYLTVRYSHPEWMVRRWWKRWGFSETEKLCRLNNKPSPTWIRTIPEDFRKNCAESSGGVKASGGQGAGSLLIQDSGPGTVESYQAAILRFRTRARSWRPMSCTGQGKLFWRLHAPGGKATHIAQLMGNRGEIWLLISIPTSWSW